MYLESTFHILVVPDPLLSSLLHSRTALGNTPQGLRNRGGLIEVQLGEGLLDGLCGGICLVVRDTRVKVMSDVRRTNLVVQKVNETPRVELVVRSVNGMEDSLDVRVILLAKVRDVRVCVLEPMYIYRYMLVVVVVNKTCDSETRSVVSVCMMERDE